MNVDRIQLRILPTYAALGAARLFVCVFLGTVKTSICRVSHPTVRSVIESPILVGNSVSANRPVYPGINGRLVVLIEVAVVCVPAVRIRQNQRKAVGPNPEKVDKVLRRLVESAAAEVAAGIREIQPLAIVGIAAVGRTVTHRGLVREYGFL